jgi:hypothetical protein
MSAKVALVRNVRLARIGFKVTAGGVHYYLAKLMLQPHETRAINLRQLRDAQAADFKQHKIPASASDGGVSWGRLENVPVEGRLVVIQRSGGVASNYDCSTCNCPDSLSYLVVTPGSFNLMPGKAVQCNAYAYFYNCNLNYYYYNVATDSSAWSSNKPAVAKMDPNTVGQVDAVAGGTAQITAQFAGTYYTFVGGYPPQCNASPTVVYASATANVLYPASLSIVSGTDSTTREATCPVGSSTGCGVTRSFTYQVVDQFGHAMTGSWIASQQVWDAIVTTSPNGLGLTGYTTTCSPSNTGPCGFYVNSLGQFPERALFACSTVCYANNTCVTAGYTNANQTAHIGSYSIVQHISYYCDHVLVNGH